MIINIVGAGLAGLSAAITLAREGYSIRLISRQRSERAQSVMAEGGINAALDTMGEDDNIKYHFEDTIRGGVYIADPNAVQNLVSRAPDTVKELRDLGCAFHIRGDKIVLRNFGGQKKKRTAYAMSSTGKVLMTTLIDECRKYEADDHIKRFAHHDFIELIIEEGKCKGVKILDEYSKKAYDFMGPVVLAIGGMNGMFNGWTTGTTQNDAQAAATLFTQGVAFSNLEMIQYHPTTIPLPAKRGLISEAARGEGGRLYIMRNGQKYYFMEEKFPELKNLMPRDVVSRQMYFAVHDDANEDQVYLEMTHIADEIWRDKLTDLREEVIHYMNIDPKEEPIPVAPGIHYFMGGIDVDAAHRTNIGNLYAAGECSSQYHGANRLGGNSTLGAIIGGKIAAETIMSDLKDMEFSTDIKETSADLIEDNMAFRQELTDVLIKSLGIVRDEESLNRAYDTTNEMIANDDLSKYDKRRVMLSRAMIQSALSRRESRGAHYRSDYPDTLDEYKKISLARFIDGEVDISFKEVADLKEELNEKKA